MIDQRCDSCGRDDEEVEAVRRVYVTPDAAGGPPGFLEADHDERWCAACRATYPHRAAD